MPKILGSIVLYSVKELSDSLGVTELTIRSYLRNGKLKGRKLGVQWYVIEDSLKEYFVRDIEPTARERITRKPAKGSSGVVRPKARADGATTTLRDIIDRISLAGEDPEDKSHLKNLFAKQRTK